MTAWKRRIHCAALFAGLEDDATIPGFALAEEFGLSPGYLLKHPKALTAAGILQSVPGPSGGCRLAKPAKRFSLLDVVLAVEGPQPAFRCCEIRRRGPSRLPASAYVKPCGINTPMLRAGKAWRAALAAERLSDVVAGFQADGDPRAVAASQSFIARHRRPQRPAPARQP